MKTMILAAFAALSLGVGVANAAIANGDQGATQQRNYGQYGLEGGGG
jgi:hypothetical protein